MKIGRLACVVFLFLAGGVCAHAADRSYYSVAVSVAVDGRLVMQPKAIALANVPVRTEIEGESPYRFVYTVTPEKGGGADAVIHVSFFDKVLGNWTLRADPALAVRFRQEASIEMPYHEGNASPRRVSVTLTVDTIAQKDVLAMFHGQVPDPTSCPDSAKCGAHSFNCGATEPFAQVLQ